MPPTGYAVSADPSTLAQLYVSVATTDAVRTQLTSQRPPRGTYSATQLLGPNGVMLPVIQVAGFAHTAKGASRFANRGSDALKAYVDQDQASYPPSQQVYLKTLSEPRGAVVFEGRRKTVPMIILFSVLTATFGFALILENLRPRASAVDGPRPRARARARRRTTRSRSGRWRVLDGRAEPERGRRPGGCGLVDSHAARLIGR